MHVSVVRGKWKFELESIDSYGLVVLQQDRVKPEDISLLVCLPTTDSELLHKSLVDDSKVFLGNTLYPLWGNIHTVYDNCAYRAQRILINVKDREKKLDTLISDIKNLQTRLSRSNMIIDSIDKKLSSAFASVPLESQDSCNMQ